jgi:hypothetical protein
MLAWGTVSSALLLAAFLVLVLSLYLLGVARAGDEAATLADRMMAVVYFRVVFIKGQLPQLLLSLALWPLLRRALPSLERSVARRAVGLALVALAAYAVVAPLLLSAAWPGWPALQLQRLEHHVGTLVLSVAAVVASALTGWRWTLGRGVARDGERERAERLFGSGSSLGA